MTPDLAAIARLDRSGVIVTAPGDGDSDMVSRYFTPAKGIAEDPVTGGAHGALAPYWARRLRKTELHAYQASRRGGELWCRVRDQRVELEGSCVFYLEGTEAAPWVPVLEPRGAGEAHLKPGEARPHLRLPRTTRRPSRVIRTL